MLSSEAIGLLLMTLVLLRARFRYPLRAGMLGIAVLGIPMIVLANHPSLPLLLALAFIGGCGTEIFGIGWQTALHEHIPNDVLSRVSSYDALGSFVAIPLGQLTFGPLANVFDAADVMTVSGIAYVLVSLVALASSSVRNLRHLPAEAVQTETTPVIEPG
jgi:MFS family permease